MGDWVFFQGKMIMVIWVPSSEIRPHKAPSDRKIPFNYRYYIRRFSNTVVANQREGRISARKYRNSRLGDFLKELQLIEGRGTGIPTIISAMSKNGSPSPDFDTDSELSYFQTTLTIHSSFLMKQDGTQVDLNEENKIETLILELSRRPKKRQELLERLDLYNSYKNYSRYIKPLVDKGWIAPTIPDKPTSKNQQYKTTADGLKYLDGILRPNQQSLFKE